MSPQTARRIALILVGAAAAVWIALPDELWPHRVILTSTIALAAVTFFDRARFAGASRTDSTMGPASDTLIGFEARVASLRPLRVEARGSVWSARPAPTDVPGGRSLVAGGRVDVVGRDGLTLLVRPAPEGGDAAAQRGR